LPIAFGCLLANLPLTGLNDPGGMTALLYQAGITTELFPLLIFVGVGAMIDFSPLLAQPQMALLGAAGQFGIFGTLLLAAWIGFPLNEAASIGVIGAIDGPTSIFVAAGTSPAGADAVAAYSYMSLIPIIQPPVMRLLTTPGERQIRMEYTPRPVSRLALVLFPPMLVTVVVGLLVPKAAPLIGSLMFGNLLRESRVVNRLSQAAQNELLNITTLLLGLTIGATMEGSAFLRWDTLGIMALGLAALALDTAASLTFGKVLCALSRGRFNPLIGAVGISASPMASRLAAKMAREEDHQNFLLMHAMGANTAGQLAGVIAGGVLQSLVAGVLR
jgi:sodium ion-translocating decarboxylase beta subunit